LLPADRGARQDFLPAFVSIFNGISNRNVIVHHCVSPQSGRACCAGLRDTIAKAKNACKVLSSLLVAGSAEPCAGRWFSVPNGAEFGLAAFQNSVGRNI
jgi:hypothetical protein